MIDLTEYKPITLVSNEHLINANGDIYSKRVGRLMTHQIKNDCHSVTLNKTTYYIHRLVMMTFCPILNYKEMYVNHKDKNRSNNNISNLEWCTQKENLDWNKINSTLSYLTYKPVLRNELKLTGEIWVSLKESCDYEISNLLRIKSVSRSIRCKNGIIKTTKDRILNPQPFSNEYLFVRLVINKKSSAHMIHRLVANNFVPNPENKPCVNHKNGIRTDNRVENLEWCTKSENMHHALDVLKTGRRGETSPTGKYKEVQIRELVAYYKAGNSKVEAARKAGISAGAAQDILTGKTWKHLKLIA